MENNDILQILSALQGLQNGQDALGREVKSLKDGQDAMGRDLAEVKDRLGHVEDRLGHVEDRLGHVEDQLGHVEDRLGHVEDRISSVEDRISHVESEMGGLKADLAFVKDKATLMEIDHGSKLSILLDVTQGHTEKLDEHTRVLNRLEEKIERLDTTQSIQAIQIERLAQ